MLPVLLNFAGGLLGGGLILGLLRYRAQNRKDEAEAVSTLANAEHSRAAAELVREQAGKTATEVFQEAIDLLRTQLIDALSKVDELEQRLHAAEADIELADKLHRADQETIRRLRDAIEGCGHGHNCPVLDLLP